MNLWVAIVLIVLFFAIGAGGAYFFQEREFTHKTMEMRLNAEERIRVIKEEGEGRLLELQAQQRQALREAKDESASIRSTMETEYKERRQEVQRSERRVQEKEEAFDRKTSALERRERALGDREQELADRAIQVEELRQARLGELERVGKMTAEEARANVVAEVIEQARRDAGRQAREIELQAREEAEAKAREIITLAIQRCASDQVSDVTATVVPLPNDEMKGRIIGREGRNIRALESATGVDVIIDDTPEAVILSGFDPVRREIARMALTRLIISGRIQPTSIEETVARARQDVENVIREEGERACLEANVTGFQPELVKLLGRLHFRTSYGQNVLNHSIEVSVLAASIAAELGADVNVCKVAGLLHDMGKAIDQEVEGPHALISGEIARRFGKSPKIIHAMVAHHATEAEPQSLEAAIVQAADAISAARPGARRETVELYIKRLEALERIANSFQGVERSFAIQAGREVRILVKPEEVDELSAQHLAREVAREIEKNVDYPGQIKICVVRETRSVEYAR
ncbi:MAG TPA: ribonuclease Y [Ktedonobacterales bacterium]